MLFSSEGSMTSKDKIAALKSLISGFLLDGAERTQRPGRVEPTENLPCLASL